MDSNEQSADIKTYFTVQALKVLTWIGPEK